jgi:serine/threonine protein kinase/WD40 repeat protein
MAMTDSSKLLDAMQRDWSSGRRRRAEEYLTDSKLDDVGAVDIIYQEYILRRECGERPAPAEYVLRFPQHADALKKQFELEAMLSESAEGDETLDSAAPSESMQALLGSDGDPLWRRQKARDSLPMPEKIGAYTIASELGSGAFGTVWLGHHGVIKKAAAIKMLHGDRINAAAYEKFRLEAELVAKLSHAAVVGVHDFGLHAGRPYIVMEYLDGGTLSKRLREDGVRTPEEATGLIISIAEAVAAAHAAGIVHRDLKPGNVLLSSTGAPKVADFGLARLTGAETVERIVAGTPNYMAPEQAEARPNVGPPADIYALGAILYELLTGRPPFQGTSPEAVLEQVVRDEPVPPRRLRPDIGRDLETIILQCLQKDPQRRYGSAGELAADLRRYNRGEPVKARPVSWPEKVWKWAKREPLTATLSTLTAIVIIGAFIGMSIMLKRTRASESNERQAKINESLRATAEEREKNRVSDILYVKQLVDCSNDLREQTRHIPAARRGLDACPANRRDWEWSVLNARVSQLSRAGDDPESIELIEARDQPGYVHETVPGLSRLQAIALGPGGRVAVAGDDGQVALREGGAWLIFRGHTEHQLVVCIAFDSRGHLVSADQSGLLLLRDLRGRELRRLHCGAQVHSILPLDSGRIAWTTAAKRDSRIGVWEADGTAKTLVTTDMPCCALARTADGFFAADFDGSIRRFLSDGTAVSSLPQSHTNKIADIAVSPDGKTLASVAGNSLITNELDEIEFYFTDIASGERRTLEGEHKARPLCIAFHPAGHRLATAGVDHDIYIWDTVNGRKLVCFDGPRDKVNGLVFDADGVLHAVDDAGVYHRWRPERAGK